MFCRVWNSVFTMPGQTTWSRTPVSPNSRASRRMKVTRKALLAAYTARRGSCGPSAASLDQPGKCGVDQPDRRQDGELHQLVRLVGGELEEGHVVGEGGRIDDQRNPKLRCCGFNAAHSRFGR